MALAAETSTVMDCANKELPNARKRKAGISLRQDGFIAIGLIISI